MQTIAKVIIGNVVITYETADYHDEISMGVI